MNLVYALISREYPTYLNDEDIIQCGMLGLCQAADKFDESMGYKFAGFAWFCIRHEIIRELKKRAKYQGVLSLDYEVNGCDGDRCSFGDFIVGEPDVLYVDSYENKLTPIQRKTVELLKKGKPPKEIAKKLGITTSSVSFTRRKLRILRSQADRED